MVERIGHAAIGLERRKGDEESARKSMETLKAFSCFCYTFAREKTKGDKVKRQK
jgi:hypothetical protein